MSIARQWRTFLNRRKAARDYFRAIPARKINLNTHLSCGVDKDGDVTDLDRSTTPGWKNHCTSVGCVAGWLWTMPQYIRWCKDHGVGLHNIQQEGTLEAYLGIDGTEYHEYFNKRQYFHIPQKKEAMDRLRETVEEAEDILEEARIEEARK